MFKKEDFSIVEIYGTNVIQVETEDFGKVLLLKPYLQIPNPIEFDSYDEAKTFLNEYFIKHKIK